MVNPNREQYKLKNLLSKYYSYKCAPVGADRTDVDHIKTITISREFLMFWVISDQCDEDVKEVD